LQQLAGHAEPTPLNVPAPGRHGEAPAKHVDVLVPGDGDVVFFALAQGYAGFIDEQRAAAVPIAFRQPFDASCRSYGHRDGCRDDQQHHHSRVL
jgi:hypothetical protein